ncbi:transcription initiation protein [Flavobacterium rivuli WB 3.3-2 = DSM 21788]|uniref:Transcription initiation protein n=1 Tax=Flavobacterium rivuli WB 3.3-2 = DSM 21788 TaxID=1121895 RepID=A0A0A2MAN4_9FLAO|nr:YciI family protein [Flavobacterium rivuli]KGO88671.1 transcription initiation protein [Flavobacterium rivuli WB 3.3-2 = DSM 21788]
MQEFLLVIRRDITSENPTPTAEQMKEAMKPYQDWVAGIAAQDKLVGTPKRWDADGRVINGTTVTKGPFGTGTNSIGGLFLIKSENYEEAVALAQGCPIIKYGATVEVRMAIPVA